MGLHSLLLRQQYLFSVFRFLRVLARRRQSSPRIPHTLTREAKRIKHLRMQGSSSRKASAEAGCFGSMRPPSATGCRAQDVILQKT
jgi:hypothetical protein